MDQAPTKENQLKRKSSDKKIFKTPNNLRNSASQLRSNGVAQAQKQFGDKQPSPTQPKQSSALGHLANILPQGVSPKEQNYFNRKG